MGSTYRPRSLLGGPLDGLVPCRSPGSTSWRWFDQRGVSYRGPADGRWLYRSDDGAVWEFAGHWLDSVCRDEVFCDAGCSLYPDPASDGRLPAECPLCGCAVGAGDRR
jgi:hypothetical protein